MLAVNSSNRSPFGTYNYSHDIFTEGKIVFIANGISDGANFNCYDNIDVKNKFVLFFYDFPDTSNNSFSKRKLSELVIEAINREVLGIILVSYKKEYPFFKIQLQDFYKKEIPILITNKENASKILHMAGRDAEYIYEQWRGGKIPKSEELIVSLRANIWGEFDCIKSDNIIFRYHSKQIPNNELEELFAENTRSIDFICDLFKKLNFEWNRTTITYFSNYDSKRFYTAHLGYGFSHSSGNYNVYIPGKLDYGLMVHENTHTLFRDNIGGNCSFFDEGIAMYSQAKATDPSLNNKKVTEFLKSGELMRLKDMLKIENIGTNHSETKIGYPASGSFFDFIIEKYGVVKIKSLWKNNLTTIYNKDIEDLEKEWLYWLRDKYNIDEELIINFLNK